MQSFEAAARDEDGQTLAEYGMILAVLATTTVVVAVVAFRSVITGSFNSAIDCLSGRC